MTQYFHKLNCNGSCLYLFLNCNEFLINEVINNINAHEGMTRSFEIKIVEDIICKIDLH